MAHTYTFPEIDRTSEGCYAWNAICKVACQLALMRGYPLEHVQLPNRYPQYRNGGAQECWPQMSHVPGQTILIFQTVPLTPEELTAVTAVMDPATACRAVFPGYGVPAGKDQNRIEDAYENLPEIFITRSGLPSNSCIMLFGHYPGFGAPGINAIYPLYNVKLNVQQRKAIEGQLAALFAWELG